MNINQIINDDNNIPKTLNIKTSMFQSKESMLAEKYFQILAIQNGWKVIPSSNKENSKEHWDFNISQDNETYNCDVKCIKKINRRDNIFQDNFCWIELEKNGNKGWLFSDKSNIIAFETTDKFLLIKVCDLQTIVNKQIKDIYVTDPQLAVNKKYVRVFKGKKDILTLIDTKIIKNKSLYIWNKTELMKINNNCNHIYNCFVGSIEDIERYNKIKSPRLKLKAKNDSFKKFRYCPMCCVKFIE